MRATVATVVLAGIGLGAVFGSVAAQRGDGSATIDAPRSQAESSEAQPRSSVDRTDTYGEIDGEGIDGEEHRETGVGATGDGAADRPTPEAADDGQRALPAGEIDLDGDLSPEDRAWLSALATAHDGELPDEPWVVRWTLSVAGEPVVDAEEVAQLAAEAFSDQRGWASGGAIRFERIASPEDADFRLVVAEAVEVPGFAEDCMSWQTGEPDASCTVGNDVIINDLRWRDGALGDPFPLTLFRIHELNHEVGHWLGQGHFSCIGGVAAVNQQQYRSLAGCQANAWPLPWERAMVAARFGLWPTVEAFEPYDRVSTEPADPADPPPLESTKGRES